MPRRRERPRRTFDSNSTEPEGQQHPASSHGISLSSLGPFRYTVKQGIRKRNKSKLNAMDDTESGSEVGRCDEPPAAAPSSTEEIETQTLPEDNNNNNNLSLPSPQLIKTIDNESQNWEDDDGDEHLHLFHPVRSVKAKKRVINPDETPTRQQSFAPALTPSTHRRQQILNNRFLSPVQYPPPYRTPLALISPTRVLYSPRSSVPYSRESTISAAVVQGVNDYKVISKSPQKEAELSAIMKSLEDVFESQEWLPELPTAREPDASPERLTVKPEPLTYTTVGSVVKASDTRQFTAPNRIQREGRAGLEVNGRRPMSTTGPSFRGQEFYPSRNAPQYNIGHTYSQTPSQSFVTDRSPASNSAFEQYPKRSSGNQAMLQAQQADHYQSTQNRRQILVRGRSAAANYDSPIQARDHRLVQDHSPTDGQVFGTQNPAQEQPYRQDFLLQQAFTSQGQDTESNSINRHNSQLNVPSPDQSAHASPSELRPTLERPQQANNEQSLITHPITAEEAAILFGFGLDLPLTFKDSCEEDPHSPNRKLQGLAPAKQALLDSFQESRPDERFENTQRQPTDKSIEATTTNQRSNLAMHQGTTMPGYTTNPTARLQDAKMSTVQRLAQFPNPDQERAKAMLAELAASKMRGYEENNYFNQTMQEAKGMNIQSDTDRPSHRGRGGSRSEMHSHEFDARQANELNHNFRFPNANPIHLHASAGGPTSIAKAAGIPRTTPQGYPQPLTAGPPGQRQNNALSSNKALNSMQQQMLANHSQRNLASNLHYDPPQHSAYPPAGQHSSVPRPSQRSAVVSKIVPDPETYPWANLDKLYRDDSEDYCGAAPRSRETLSMEDAKRYYPDGMDMDTAMSFIPTLSVEEATKYYPSGMDEGTKRWYEQEREWQQNSQFHMGSLLDGSIPFKDWQHKPKARTQTNFNTIRRPDLKQPNKDSTEAWAHSSFGVETNSNHHAQSDNPGVIGQDHRTFKADRRTSKAGQSGNDKSFTLDEIKSTPLPEITAAAFQNLFATLIKYKGNTPEDAAMLKERGFVPAPEHAIDRRPNGNDSFF